MPTGFPCITAKGEPDMDISELTLEQIETLRCLGDERESGTLFMEYLNELVFLGVCVRDNNGNLQLSELGKELYGKIANRDSD